MYIRVSVVLYNDDGFSCYNNNNSTRPVQTVEKNGEKRERKAD